MKVDLVADETQFNPVVIALDPAIYAELNLYRALEPTWAESGVIWDQSFNNASER